jgi:hypothetical protein
LNYRWLHPAREKYFDERLAPAIATASHFYVLGTTGDPGVDDYMELFARWVESKWPSRFVVARTHYGNIELLEFRAQGLGSQRRSSRFERRRLTARPMRRLWRNSRSRLNGIAGLRLFSSCSDTGNTSCPCLNRVVSG